MAKGRGRVTGFGGWRVLAVAWRVVALAWRWLARAWRVLVLAWQLLCTWQVRWQGLVGRSRGHATREFFEYK